MFIKLSEIQYLQSKTDASIQDISYLIECAVCTIQDLLIEASEQDSNSCTGVVIDNEWNEIEVSVLFSDNPQVMPHLLTIDNDVMNAEYAVQVLAAYIHSIELQRLNNYFSYYA